MSIEVIKRGRSIGAEIRGADLSKPLTDDAFAAIYTALLEYKAVYFRNQPMTPDQQIAFGQRFGALEHNPFRPELAGQPEVQIIRNDKDHPVLSTDIWHADLTFREHPTKFTILRCLGMPDYGGDTMWADMCAAYRGLSAPVRDFVTGLRAVHDFKNFRLLYSDDPSKRDALHQMEDLFPNPSHPVVATHPETGLHALFVNRQFTVRIEGLSELESRNILEILTEQARVPEYQFRLEWEPDTLAIWDNRSCQHYAVNDYYPYARHMERVAVAGDARPVYDPNAKPILGEAEVARVHAYEGLH